MKKVIILIILSLLFSSNSYAEKAKKDDDLDYLLLLAKTFAECHGVFKAYGEFFESTNKPLSETMKGSMRGAYYSALWTLNSARRLQSKPSKPLKHFADYVLSVSEGFYNHVLALLSTNTDASYRLELCVNEKIQKSQRAIVDLLREEMYQLK